MVGLTVQAQHHPRVCILAPAQGLCHVSFCYICVGNVGTQARASSPQALLGPPFFLSCLTESYRISLHKPLWAALLPLE